MPSEALFGGRRLPGVRNRLGEGLEDPSASPNGVAQAILGRFAGRCGSSRGSIEPTKWHGALGSGPKLLSATSRLPFQGPKRRFSVLNLCFTAPWLGF